MRAVGFNPEAAHYGGISVARNYFLAMAISGGFAGLAGAIDIVGWQYRINTNDVLISSQIAFVGIAVALLGRNKAIGVGLAALLFAALTTGTSTRNLDPEIFRPELASNLTAHDPGPRRALRRRGRPDPLPAERAQARPAAGRDEAAGVIAAVTARLPRGDRALAWVAILLGIAAFWVALPPLKVREPVVPIILGLFALTIGIGTLIRGVKRIGWGAVAIGVLGLVLGYLATRSSIAHLDQVVVWSALTAAMLRYATPLAFAAMGGIFSERSGVVNIGLEGMMLSGAFFGILGADKLNSWPLGLLCAALAGGAFALIHAFFAISLRADQIVGGTAINFLALGITGYLFIDIYGGEGTPPNIPKIPNVHLSFLEDWYFIGPVLGSST